MNLLRFSFAITLAASITATWVMVDGDLALLWRALWHFGSFCILPFCTLLVLTVLYWCIEPQWHDFVLRRSQARRRRCFNRKFPIHHNPRQRKYVGSHSTHQGAK